MKERNIGDTRTFERFQGKWKIIAIDKDKSLTYTFRLNNEKCPFCNKFLYPEKTFTFNYIETLQEGGRKIYLGIAKEKINKEEVDRYIVLNDYVNIDELKKKLRS